jgi:hypothetical protein
LIIYREHGHRHCSLPSRTLLLPRSLGLIENSARGILHVRLGLLPSKRRIRARPDQANEGYEPDRNNRRASSARVADWLSPGASAANLPRSRANVAVSWQLDQRPGTAFAGGSAIRLFSPLLVTQCYRLSGVIDLPNFGNERRRGVQDWARLEASKDGNAKDSNRINCTTT